MQRRIYAPQISSKAKSDSSLEKTRFSNQSQQINSKIFYDQNRSNMNPFKTPNNASKRLLEVIRTIELKYSLKNQETELDNYSDDSNVSYSPIVSKSMYIQPNDHNDDFWYLDSPKDDQELVQPHQSRLNTQFQRIIKAQEKIKKELKQIKKKIEDLDNEYEFMDNVLDLSF